MSAGAGNLLETRYSNSLPFLHSSYTNWKHMENCINSMTAAATVVRSRHWLLRIRPFFFSSSSDVCSKNTFHQKPTPLYMYKVCIGLFIPLFSFVWPYTSSDRYPNVVDCTYPRDTKDDTLAQVPLIFYSKFQFDIDRGSRYLSNGGGGEINLHIKLKIYQESRKICIIRGVIYTTRVFTLSSPSVYLFIN